MTHVLSARQQHPRLSAIHVRIAILYNFSSSSPFAPCLLPWHFKPKRVDLTVHFLLSGENGTDNETLRLRTGMGGKTKLKNFRSLHTRVFDEGSCGRYSSFRAYYFEVSNTHVCIVSVLYFSSASTREREKPLRRNRKRGEKKTLAE